MGQQLDELNQGSRKRRLNSSASVVFRYTVIWYLLVFIYIYMFNKYILLNLRNMRSKLDRTCSVLVHSCFRNVGLHIYEWATFWIKFGLLRYLIVFFTHPPTPGHSYFVASRYLILKEPHSCFGPFAYDPSFQLICHSFGVWYIPLGLPHHRFACTNSRQW